MNFAHLQSIRIYELERMLSILKKLNKLQPEITILEIGAGTGWQAKELDERGYCVEAIDINSSNYQEGRVWPIQYYDGVHIPFEDDHFDIVFSSNTLEHIKDLESFQKEMQRVLKPNGYAIHIVPSGTWRIWSTITHYPSAFMKILKILLKRSATDDKAENSTVADVAPSISTKIINILLPARHGETGNFISETYYFSFIYWRSAFQRAKWKIDYYQSNQLFYTGYSILGMRLSIPNRKFLSRLLGSACHIFVLSK